MDNERGVANDGKLVSLNGELRLLSEDNPEFQQRVELWLLNDEVNRNNWRYERLGEHRHLFAETPILIAYVNGKIGDGHNFKEVRQSDGSVLPSFVGATAERIVGYFKSDSDIRLERRDDKQWIVGTGYLWKWYALELVEKLARLGREGMSVSIETLIEEMHLDDTTEVYTKYQILGTTILGDDVEPAVKDANIRALSQLGGEEVRKMTLRVASAQTAGKTAESPQNINTKEKNKSMEMNCLNLEFLRKKFDGYKVLTFSGKGEVVLLSEDNKIMTYRFLETDSIDADIARDRLVEGSVRVNFDDGSMEISIEGILGGLYKELKAANSELKDKGERVGELEKEVEELRKIERARRDEIAKQAILDVLREFNENRCDEEKLAEDEMKDLLKDAEDGKYAEICDEKGWCGDKKAEVDAAAICAKRQMKIDKEKADRAKDLAANHWAFEPAHDKDKRNAIGGIADLVKDL